MVTLTCVKLRESKVDFVLYLMLLILYELLTMLILNWWLLENGMWTLETEIGFRLSTAR
jgi:hypothetical protein